jgi:hypothetical protein
VLRLYQGIAFRVSARSLYADHEVMKKDYARLAAVYLTATPAPAAFERPLSTVEHHLWCMTRSMAEAGARGFALLRMGVVLEGPLELDTLKAALSFVTSRHDIFRTSYAERDGDVFARVSADSGPLIEVIDMADRPEDVDAWFDEQSKLGFQLDHPPLHRFVLVRMGPTTHRLYSFAHHIVCDGLSYGTMFRELASTYTQIASGQAPRLGRALQYSELARWQAGWVDDAVRAEYARFWQRHLPVGVPPPPIAAIGDAVGGPGQSRWAVTSHEGERPLGEALLAFCHAHLVTAPQVLFATLVTMLELEGAGGSPIGYMSANRRRETMRTVGLFATIFPVRVPTGPGDSFAAILARSVQVVDEAMRYQDLPPRFAPADGAPPYRVTFSCGSSRGGEPVAIDGVRSRIFVGYAKQQALLDLWLNLTVGDEGILKLTPEYNADLLTAEAVNAYLARFQAVLSAALSDPECTVAELATVSAADVGH